MSHGNRSIGDWLVRFGPAPQTMPTRDRLADWRSVYSAENNTLYTTLQTNNWNGFPLCADEYRNWAYWLLGDLFNTQDRDAFVRRLIDNPALATEINGQCILFAHDASCNEWHVWTNRFGTVHAYVSPSGLGTFSPAVAHDNDLDWEALAGFCAFGFFPQDRTYWRGVRVLRPATHYVFDGDGREVLAERYWQWWHRPDYRRTYDATVDQFADVFHTVLQDQAASGRVAIPISGGLDSRSTVAALTQAGQSPDRRFWSYSYGYSADSVETRIARQVAKRRGLPFEAITIEPYLLDQLADVTAWTEGFQNITQSRQAFIRNRMTNSADALIGGLWGDVWLDDMGLVDQPGAGEAETVQHALKKMLKGGRRWLLANLIQPQLPDTDLDDLLHHFIETEMQPLNHIADADFRVKAFKTEQWSFRWSIPPIRVFQSAAWPLLVFYDTRLTDFFCTVPTSFVSQRRLQVDYLKRYAPDLARVPWQVYDANLYRYQHFNTWQLPKRALKKGWRLARRKQVLERNWEVQFMGAASRTKLQQTLLEDATSLHTLIDRPKIETLLSQFFDAPLVDKRGYTVAMLLTLAAKLA